MQGNSNMQHRPGTLQVLYSTVLLLPAGAKCVLGRSVQLADETDKFRHSVHHRAAASTLIESQQVGIAAYRMGS